MTALRIYTEYSLLDGECRLSQIVERAKELSYTAVAKTDVGTLSGSVEFWEYAKKCGINPIIGCQISSFIKGEKVCLLLLAENNEGLLSLNIISSYVMTEGSIQEKELLKHGKGVLAVLINTEELMYNIKVTENVFGALKASFSHFYCGLERLPNESELKTRKQFDIASSLGTKCVISNAVYITKEENGKVKAFLDYIREGKTPSSTCPHYLRSKDELAELFSHLPSVYQNTETIGKMCRVSFDTEHMHLPTFPVDDAPGLLEEKARGGLEKLSLSKNEKYAKRLKAELDVIDKMGFADYFLITEDFVSYAKSKNIPIGPGRGSGVGSLVAYALGITAIDPVENGLLFERFLNEERVSMPDFDIDMGDERRGEVVEYVKEKYGKKYVCSIVNFSKFAMRQCIRDVGKFLKTDVSELTSLIPDKVGITVDEAVSSSDALKRKWEFDPKSREVLSFCKLLEGRPRAVSPHPSGIILSKEPLIKYMPLTKWGEETLSQYSMETCAKLGLLKIDFLGIKYLTVICKAKKLIGEDVYPVFDKGVFQMLSMGESDGVFQLESDGMKELLKKMRPESVDDLACLISLYRPGPKIYIDEYIRGRNHPQSIKYKTEAERKVLSSTYGCPIYQEQIMNLCREAAGFTLGHADTVRRAMAKKDEKKMALEESAFVSGCVNNGIDEEYAVVLFNKIKGFAKYAFNKSHAAAYAVLAYETAFLKYRYPREYFSARLDSVAGTLSKISSYALSLGKMGARLLPPCINESEAEFTPCDEGVRYSLSAVKGVGMETAKKIISERNKGGKFKSSDDFLFRMKNIGQNAMFSLAKAGAFDIFGETRSTIVNLITDHVSPAALQNVSEDQLTFSFDFGDKEINYKRRHEKEFDETTKRLFEKEYTGVDFHFEYIPVKTHVLYIRLTAENKENLSFAMERFTRKGGDNIVRIYDTERDKVLETKNISFNLDSKTVHELEQLMGEGNVKLKALERINK